MEWQAIYRRASGRRHYNLVRQFCADKRRRDVARLLRETGIGWGYQTRIARQLSVSRSTVCRDLARIRGEYWGGPQAEERHRADMRMERRIRAEDKLEWERIASDARKAESAEEPSAPPSDRSGHLGSTEPWPQLPKRLPSLGSDLGNLLRPKRGQFGHRRGA